MKEYGDIVIRPAQGEDLETIVRFNVGIAWETEGVRLEMERLRKGVEAVLADPLKGHYLVAVCEGVVVGQLLITFEWSDWRNGCFWWLQSVYVDEAFRRRGVFRSLFQHVLAQARADPKVCGVRLYMDRHNVRARRTYRALGMDESSYDVFEIDLTELRRDGDGEMGR